MKYWLLKLLFATWVLTTFYIFGLATLDLVGLIEVLIAPPTFQSVETTEFAAALNKMYKRFAPFQKEESIGEFTRTLPDEREFERLVLSGGDLVDQALTYLAQPDHTPLERRIAVHAIQKAPVSEWVRFANVMLDRYEKNQVDFWELDDTIFPRRFYSQHPTDDFWRPGVRHVLYRLYFAHDIDKFDENVKINVILCLTGLDTLIYALFYCARCA